MKTGKFLKTSASKNAAAKMPAKRLRRIVKEAAENH